jgi:hypothetical protein
MSRRFDKVQASMNPVVDHLLTVDPVLLFEVGVETRFDVVEDGFPSLGWREKLGWREEEGKEG